MEQQFVGREEFQMFVKHIESEQGEQNRRLGALDDIVKSINSLAIEMGKMNTTMGNMVLEIAEQGKRIGAIEKTPSDRWNSLITTVIASIVAGVIGYALASAGLK